MTTLNPLPGRFEKLGCVLTPHRLAPQWVSHAMAPAAVELAGFIRVYMGGWDEGGISRIYYADVDAENPSRVLRTSTEAVLDIGAPGTFDENGVFPAHVAMVGGKVYLYYTGFQLGRKVRHYNFGGLAVSGDGDRFVRASQAPVLDRADEGFCVRAGQSVLVEGGVFHTCYSAGTAWEEVGGKQRPTYDVYYQASPDGISYRREGRCIVRRDAGEHGLGRPQIIRLFGRYIVCYTRRMRDMRYHMGCAVSDDLREWRRADAWLAVPHGAPDAFDSEMAYFPALLQTRAGAVYLFYSGNDFGRGGLGVARFMP